MASGADDDYSDIDLEWRIPGESFGSAIGAIPGAFGDVGAISSFRSDPDFRDSDSRKILFLRFAGIPLFWRVDLDCIATTPVTPDQAAIIRNLATPWSNTESVLMNCVASIKWMHRHKPEMARALLERALTRLGAPAPETLGAVELIEKICAIAAAMDPTKAILCDSIRELASSKIDPPGKVKHA